MNIKDAAAKWSDNSLMMEFEEVIFDKGRNWTQEAQDDYDIIKLEIFKRMAAYEGGK